MAKPREFEKLVSDRALEFVDEVTRAIAAHGDRTQCDGDPNASIIADGDR
jgi:hypothetical protein